MLYLDTTGLWLMTKRLEQHTFPRLKSSVTQGAKMQLTPETLAMLSDEIDLKGARMRPWYQQD